MTKKNDEAVAALKPLFAPEFELLKIEGVNHRPDVFCIGPKHIDAAQECGGILDERAMSEHPCCNCKQPLSAHTSDLAAFLRRLAPGEPDKFTEAESARLVAVRQELEKHGIDGVAFVR